MVHSSTRRKRDKSSSRSKSSRSSSASSSSRSSSRSSSSSITSRSRSRSRSVSKSKTKFKASRSSSPSGSHSSRSVKSTASKSDRRRSPSPITNRIHINRLTRNVNKNHLIEIFKSYGSVKTVDLPMDKNHPHLGRGIAMVEFEKSADAEKAIRYMDGGQIDGQEIAVSKIPFRMGPKSKGGQQRNGGRRRLSPRR